MKDSPLHPVLFVVVLTLGSGQEVSFHPPRFSRNYSISYDVSPMATVYPPYNVTSPDDYMYFAHEFLFPNADDDAVFIGAKDWFFQLSGDFTVSQSLYWNITSAHFDTCMGVLEAKQRLNQINYECGNHIRTYRKFPDVADFAAAQGRMAVCGTYGLEPRCITVNISNINDISPSVDSSSSGICSVHPDAPTFGDFHGGNTHYFAMGFSDDRGKDFPAGMYPVVYDSDTKSMTLSDLPVFGIPSENQWIASKVEIIDFRVQDYPESGEVYIIFLRENFQSTGSTTGTVQSRILRICKSDPGSEKEVGSPKIKYFKSFTKARLVCRHTVPDLPSSTGINDFDWPALRAVAYTQLKSRFYGFQGIWSHLVYAMFTGQVNAPNGTGICVYDTDPDPPPLSIDDHYTAYSIFRDSTFVGESSEPKSNADFFNCSSTPRTDDDARQTLAVDNVSPYLDNEHPLLEMDGVIGTKLATDTACVKNQLDPGSCLVQDVLFVGTANGRVMKIVIAAQYSEGSGVLTQVEPEAYTNYDYVPVVTEEWKLDDSNEVQGLVVRGGYVYVTTVSRVYKFPTHHCPHYTTCSSCIGSQDPYCYWDEVNSKCVTFNHTNNSPTGIGSYSLPAEYRQNITTGEDSVCNEMPECDLQCTPKMEGFDIKFSCFYSQTFYYYVSSACSGQDFIQTDNGIPLNSIDGDILDISDASILGNRLHIVDILAISSEGQESTYSLRCLSNPTPPEPVKEGEVIAIPVSATEVDILVALRACSLTDSLENYLIEVTAYTADGFYESFNYSNKTSVSLSSLEECTSFSYSVRVTNSRGFVTYTSPENATVVPGIPGTPTGLTVSGRTSRGAVVSWTDPSLTPCGISGYSVYLNGEQIYRCLPLDSSSFTFTGLFPYTNYTVVVRACTMTGEGPASDSTSVITLCEPPSRVQNLILEEKQSSSLRFTWDEPLLRNGSDFSYTVEYTCYDQVELSVTSSSDSMVQMPTFTINDLRPLTLCCVKIFQTATCLGEELSGLPVQMCNTTSASTPECPTDLTAVPTSYQSLLVQWSTPSNAVLGLNYTVRVEPVETAPTVPIPLVHSLDNTFAFFNGLNPNTTYNVHLSVDYTGGAGSGSAPGSGTGECVTIMGTTPVGTPPAPDNVQLMSVECALMGSWTDPYKSSYNVVSYNVYARCNDVTTMQTVPSDNMSMSFNICNATGALYSGADLSWCSLQVQSCDSVSCGQLSELALTVVPDSRPAMPRCFITQEVGTTVFISYTLSAPYALDDLYVKYSLTPTTGVSVEETMPFDGNNTLSFDDLSRDQEYSFSLQLCDTLTKCGNSCSIVFSPNTTTPAYPRNLRCNTSSTAVTVDWDMVPDENANAIEFQVQLGGGKLVAERSMTVGNGGLSTTFTDLSPFGLYFVTAMAVDMNVDISSPPSPSIECRTLSSKPMSLKAISSSVGTIDERTVLTIYWIRPDDFNGNFSHYTFVWGIAGSTGSRNPSCQELYEANPLSNVMVTDFSLSNTTVVDDSIVRADAIQLCGRVSNSEFTSDWLEQTMNTTLGASTDSEPTSAALISVIVLAAVSIIAALLIAIILAIAICSRRNVKLNPSETVEDMKGSNSTHPASVQRSQSTKPIMDADDEDHNSDNVNNCTDNNDYKNNSSKYD